MAAHMLDSLITADDAGRARFSSRLAAFLFFGSGVLLLVNVPLPGRPDINRVGELIVENLEGLAKNGESGNAAVENSVRERAQELTRRFPIYG